MFSGCSLDLKEYGILILTLIVSYLIGCINSSILVTRILKVEKDIRTLGSGNPGFTNTLRTMGKKIAILTFIGDFSKGVLAVWFSKFILKEAVNIQDNMIIVQGFLYFSAFMCVVGHIYPCFFSFRGGKGILTAWATSLLIDWRIFLILISVFLVVLIFTKIVSVASLSAAVAYPVSAFLVNLFVYSADTLRIIVPTSFALLISILVIFKHKSNISRIMKGTEKRISINKV